MPRIRLEDVARDAEVSVATVTRVIRSSGHVSEEKRARVEASIVKLGYVVPSPQSRQPIPDVRIIGHIIRKTHTNLLFARIADSVNAIAMEHGYYVLTINVEDDYTPQQLIDHINVLRGYGASGIIMSALGDTVDLSCMQSFMRNMEVPIVMVERVANLMRVNKVILNAKESLIMATRHLLDRGHRRIAYMAPDWQAEVEQLRLSGYREAIAEVDGAQDIYLACDKYRAQEGYERIAQYAKTSPLPTAVVANDTLLSGVQQYLYEKGLRVPEHVSLVGTDDTLAQFASPPLTSLAFPEHDMARTAIEIILDAASKKEMMPRTILLSTRLIRRDSVAPPREA